VFTLRAVAVAALATMCSATTAAQQQRAEDYAKVLEGADRVARMQVPRVVQALGVKPGDKVVDLGSGSGLFSRPLGKAVAPDGVVYAIDIDEELLRIVERSARAEGLGNVKTVVAGTADPHIPEPVDLIFICDALHHFGDQAAYLKRLTPSVKPGGRIAVIDFTETWPGGHDKMRYTPGQLDEWMSAAGFARSASHDFLENSFFVIYQKK
jgi:arsenite methyltransferase